MLLSLGSIFKNFIYVLLILSNSFVLFQFSWSIHAYEYVKNLSVSISNFIDSVLGPVNSSINSLKDFTSSNR